MNRGRKEQKISDIYLVQGLINADIVLLETYSTSDKIICSLMWDGSWYFSHDSTLQSKGVLVLINSHLDFKVLSLISDQIRRYILIKVI